MTEAQAEAALAMPSCGAKRLESKQTQTRIQAVIEFAVQAGWIKRPDPAAEPPKKIRHKRQVLGY